MNEVESVINCGILSKEDIIHGLRNERDVSKKLARTAKKISETSLQGEVFRKDMWKKALTYSAVAAAITVAIARLT